MPRGKKCHAPWFRKGRGWFVTVDGKQYALDVVDQKDEAGASEAAAKFIASLSAGIAEKLSVQPTGPTTTASDAVAAFLLGIEKRVAAGKTQPSSLTNLRICLLSFTGVFGKRAVGSLTAEELEGWADRPEWSASTQHVYLANVQRVLRSVGIALAVQRPHKESRGADTCLSDEQFAAVMVEAKKFKGVHHDFPEFLQALRETGARPQEIASLRSEWVDWANCCTRLRHHKTRRYTGTDRIIHFNSKAMAVLLKQRKRYGDTGLLFRTRDGNSYRPNTIVHRLRKISDRLGYRVIAYGLGRHAFATRALKAGVSDVLVAGLLGHKSTAMLHAHYSHLTEDAQAMRDAAERAASRQAG